MRAVRKAYVEEVRLSDESDGSRPDEMSLERVPRGVLLTLEHWAVGYDEPQPWILLDLDDLIAAVHYLNQEDQGGL